MSQHKHTQSFDVVGMHCASCASMIKRKLQNIPGIDSCEVNYGTEKAKVSYDPKKVTLEDMNHQIHKLGYALSDSTTAAHSHGLHEGHDMMTPITSDQTVKQRKLAELSALKKQVYIVMPFVFFSFGMMIWEIGAEPLRLWSEMPEVVKVFFHHLLPVMATYTLFVIGLPYLKGMVRFFRYGAANMDSLVGIGTSVAFLFSFILSAFETTLATYINVEQTYYDVTIVVIGFITLGKYLEARSKLRTGEAIERLLGLQAKSATVIRDGHEIEIPLDEVVEHDVVLVKPGQKIPVDGKILEGSSAIDESMITGESIPVDKTKGDLVIGATLNKQGFLKVETTQIGSNTMLSQIIKMVEQAQSSKAPIEKLADQISAVFVPLVLILSMLVLVIWIVVGSQFMPFSQALTLGILSVVGTLVIACPCAMGLATPTAVIVGVGKAAQRGILIKNAEHLEKFHAIDYVVMDKTGTITKGLPEVTDIVVDDEHNEKEVLRIIASLEHHSEHPLALAIVEKAKNEHIDIQTVEDFSNIEGKGVTGKISGVQYFVGNQKLVLDHSLSIDQSMITEFTTQGKTPIIVMNEKKILGYVAVADTLKEEAKEVMNRLHQLGIQVALLTGDHKNTAQYIAKQVGIDTVIAEVLPADKAKEIQQLQKEGYRVAMVGDGINDAPALATADVGVAMGTGTDVAIESAGITLLSGNISKLPESIMLAKATMRTIKQNLFWAFFYNIVSIPIAAGVFYPLFGILLNPAIAGAAMAFSSVSVVLNALRLKTVKV